MLMKNHHYSYLAAVIIALTSALIPLNAQVPGESLREILSTLKGGDKIHFADELPSAPLLRSNSLQNEAEWTDWEPYQTSMAQFRASSSEVSGGFSFANEYTLQCRHRADNPHIMQLRFPAFINGTDYIADYDLSTYRLTLPELALQDGYVFRPDPADFIWWKGCDLAVYGIISDSYRGYVSSCTLNIYFTEDYSDRIIKYETIPNAPSSDEITLRISQLNKDADKIYISTWYRDFEDLKNIEWLDAMSSPQDFDLICVPVGGKELPIDIPIRLEHPGGLSITFFASDAENRPLSLMYSASVSSNVEMPDIEWEPYSTAVFHDLMKVADKTAQSLNMLITFIEGLEWATTEYTPSWEVSVERAKNNPALFRIRNPYAGNCPFRDGSFECNQQMYYIHFDYDNNYDLIIDTDKNRIYSTPTGVVGPIPGYDSYLDTFQPAAGAYAFTTSRLGSRFYANGRLFLELPLEANALTIDTSDNLNGVRIIEKGDALARMDYLIAPYGSVDLDAPEAWTSTDPNIMRGSTSTIGAIDFSAFKLTPFAPYSFRIRGLDKDGNTVNEGYSFTMSVSDGIHSADYLTRIYCHNDLLAAFGEEEASFESGAYTVDDALYYALNPMYTHPELPEIFKAIKSCVILDIADRYRLKFGDYNTHIDLGYGEITICSLGKYLEEQGNDPSLIEALGLYGYRPQDTNYHYTFDEGTVVLKMPGFKNGEPLLTGCLEFWYSPASNLSFSGVAPDIEIKLPEIIKDICYTIMPDNKIGWDANGIISKLIFNQSPEGQPIVRTDERISRVPLEDFDLEEYTDYTIIGAMLYENKNRSFTRQFRTPAKMSYKCDAVYSDFIHDVFGFSFPWYTQERTVEVYEADNIPGLIFIKDPYASFNGKMKYYSDRYIAIDLRDPEKVTINGSYLGIDHHRSELAVATDGAKSGTYDKASGEIRFPSGALRVYSDAANRIFSNGEDHLLLTLPPVSGLDSPIISEPEAPVEYFDLSGRRIDSPREGGFYIRRQGSTATKIKL